MKINLLFKFAQKPFHLEDALGVPGPGFMQWIMQAGVQRRYVEHQIIVHRSARLTQKVIDSREQDWQHKSGSTNARMRRLTGGRHDG